MKRIYSSVLKKSAKKIPDGEFSCFTRNYSIPMSVISQQFGQKKSSLAPDPIRVWTYV